MSDYEEMVKKLNDTIQKIFDESLTPRLEEFGEKIKSDVTKHIKEGLVDFDARLRSVEGHIINLLITQEYILTKLENKNILGSSEEIKAELSKMNEEYLARIQARMKDDASKSNTNQDDNGTSDSNEPE